MAFPGARLLRLTKHGLDVVKLEDTEHFRLLREFCSDPATFVETMMLREEGSVVLQYRRVGKACAREAGASVPTSFF
jgi:hypothetical protein